MALAVISGWVELLQSVDWSLTTECPPPDQETSERRPYAPQGATGGKLTNGVYNIKVFCMLLRGCVSVRDGLCKYSWGIRHTAFWDVHHLQVLRDLARLNSLYRLQINEGTLKTNENFSLYLDLSSINPYSLSWVVEAWKLGRCEPSFRNILQLLDAFLAADSMFVRNSGTHVLDCMVLSHRIPKLQISYIEIHTNNSEEFLLHEESIFSEECWLMTVLVLDSYSGYSVTICTKVTMRRICQKNLLPPSSG
jgi:hypothetical protein